MYFDPVSGTDSRIVLFKIVTTVGFQIKLSHHDGTPVYDDRNPVKVRHAFVDINAKEDEYEESKYMLQRNGLIPLVFYPAVENVTSISIEVSTVVVIRLANEIVTGDTFWPSGAIFGPERGFLVDKRRQLAEQHVRAGHGFDGAARRQQRHRNTSELDGHPAVHQLPGAGSGRRDRGQHGANPVRRSVHGSPPVLGHLRHGAHGTRHRAIRRGRRRGDRRRRRHRTRRGVAEFRECSKPPAYIYIFVTIGNNTIRCTIHNDNVLVERFIFFL